MTATADNLLSAGWRATLAIDCGGGAWVQQFENCFDPRLVLHIKATERGGMEAEHLYVPDLDRQLDRNDWDGAAEALRELDHAIPRW